CVLLIVSLFCFFNQHTAYDMLRILVVSELCKSTISHTVLESIRLERPRPNYRLRGENAPPFLT
ncbi:hypothetical protein, partial [Rhizobium sp. SEMIA 4085]|uniref:hypothetical protein n=1 Tax=Rhizobium sp. SEMIA 4085 TaxID=2137761 RepID=UPI001AEDBC12